MPNRRMLAALAVLGTVLAAPAHAVSRAGVQAAANYETIGVRAFLAGDLDSAATCRLFYRHAGSGAPYDSGVVMVRRFGTLTYVGKLFWLTPATTYDFYVEVSEPGHDLLATPPETLSTRAWPLVNYGGPDVYVDGTHGDDKNDGLSPGHRHAKATILDGVRALAALPNEGRGGRVVVAPGVYHAQTWIQYGHGTPDLLYTLTGDGTGTVLISGAHPAVENGYVTGTQKLAWEQVSREIGIYRAWFPMGDSVGYVQLGDAERLHRARDLTELIRGRGTGAGGPWASGSTFGDWTWRADTLYVRRADRSDPTGQVVHAGYLHDLLWLQRPYWRIANLTFAYAGGDSSQDSNRGYELHIGGGLAHRANATVIDSCTFLGTAGDNLWGTRASDSVLVRGCKFDDLVKSLGYAACKGHAEETSGVDLGGRLWAVTGNFFTRLTNAIGGGGYAGNSPTHPDRADTTITADCDFWDNLITDCNDDAFEIELAHDINVAYWYNTVDRTNNCVSMAPVWTGPEWILYNTFARPEEGIFKQGDGNDWMYGRGDVLIYQNTCVTTGGRCQVINSSGGAFARKKFRNNIMIGGGRGFHMFEANNHGRIAVAGPDTVGIGTNDLDYDLVEAIPGSERLVRFGVASLDLAGLRAATGWEQHGVSGPAMFADSTTYRLAPGSPAIGAGVRIPGINTLPGMIHGSGPDIGRQAFTP